MKSKTSEKIFKASSILTSLLLVLALAFISLNNGKANIIPLLKGYMSVLLSGSLGKTIHGGSVITEVLVRFPRTLILSMLSLVAGTFCGVLTGMLFSFGGSKRKTIQLLTNTIPVSIPDVLIILLLQLAMGLLNRHGLPHLPVTGYGNPGNLVLPVLSLSITPCFYMARITYAYSSETYAEKFILTARAKGCSASRIHWVHVWRRVRPQIIESVYGLIPLLISNLLLVEKMFIYPGLSYNLFRALKESDIYMFIGLTMGLAAVYSLSVLAVWVCRKIDFAYGRAESR